MVTLCTTKCNINIFYVLPTKCISVFCTSEQTASFAPCDINWLTFVNEPESVYWTVRTEFLSIIQVKICLLNLFNVSHLKVTNWDIFLHYGVVRLIVHRRLPPIQKTRRIFLSNYHGTSVWGKWSTDQTGNEAGVLSEPSHISFVNNGKA